MNRNIEKIEYVTVSNHCQLFFWKLGSVDVLQMSTVTSPPWCQAIDVMCLRNSGAEGQADYLQ